MTLDLIDPTRRDAVRRALAAAFGRPEPEATTRLADGMSGAEVFRIEVDGRAHLLRLERGEGQIQPTASTYGAMRIAAAQGVAPPVRYAEAQDGVAILDYVEQQPLVAAFIEDRPALFDRLAERVRSLHAAPPFPAVIDYMSAMDGVLARFRGFELVPRDGLSAALAAYAPVRAAYRTRAEDAVSSHNDLNPRNVLYDGERIWFVDWESAFVTDRFVDLAAVANFFARTEAEAQRLLAAYLGREAGPAERARLYLMRQINHLFYGAILMSHVAMERPELRLAGLEGPDLAAVGAALGAGSLNLNTWQGRLDYGRARLGAGLAGCAAPAAAEAIAALGVDG